MPSAGTPIGLLSSKSTNGLLAGTIPLFGATTGNLTKMNPMAISRSARRGTSLVEVMVVLVVLLIGVFAVIRVFPAGLTFLRTSGNRIIATRFAQAMAEQLKADEANLPDHVEYGFIETGNPLTIVGTDPDDLSTRPDGNPYYSDVNKWRRIRGEAVRIGMPTPGAFGSGFPYMVKFGPIYLDSAFGDPTTVPTGHESYLSVVSAPFISADSNAESESGSVNPYRYRGALRSARHYVLDSGIGGGGAYLLVLPSSRERTFRVRCLVAAGDAADGTPGSVRSVEDSVVVPAGAYQWVPLPSVGDGEAVVPGSDLLTRAFRRLPAGDNWTSDDPYEYKLVSSNIASSPGGSSYANLGQLAFHPAGATQAADATSGQQGFVAYVDYYVLDWHILHDDREVPAVAADAAGAVPIKLTLGKIKRNGDPNSDNTLYDGLFPSADTDPSSNYDLRIIRLDTGAVLVQGDYDLRADTDAGADYWVRDGRDGTWDTGAIYLNSNRLRAGTPVRVLYKGDGDWAVCVQKAASTYRAWIASQAGRPPVSGGAGGLVTGDPSRFGLEGTRLYWFRSEINKSVVVRLETVDSSGERTRLAPVQLNIDRTDGDHSYADLARYLPAGTSSFRVVGGEIQGVSTKVRVVWKDRVDDRAPWQVQDLDTYLSAGGIR